MKNTFKMLLCASILFGCAAAPTMAENIDHNKERPADGQEVKPTDRIYPGQVITTTKPLACGELGSVLTSISNDFQEEPIITAKQPIRLVDGTVIETMIMILFNQKTKSYTILETLPQNEGVICVLASGKIDTITLPVWSGKTGLSL